MSTTYSEPDTMSRDGLYMVTGATWSGDGCHEVRVVEMIGERPASSGTYSRWNAKRIRTARDTAKRVDPRARYSRMDSEVFESGQTAWTFTIARANILR